MHIFFDFIIFGFLLIDIPFILWLLKKKRNAISSIKRKTIFACAILAWVTVFYGSFIEPKQLNVVNESFTIGSGERIMNIAILGDLHLGPYKGEAYLHKVIDQVLLEQPDLVFLVGDYIYGNEDEIELLTPLKRLTDEITTYGILGNHDYDLSSSKDDVDDELAEAVRMVLTEAGVILMEDESRPLDSVQLWLTGSQEYWTHRSDLNQALRNRSSKELPTILLAHNPDIATQVTAEQEIDLVLSGHTHGGQIRLPILGPIGPIPTELGQKYDRGFFSLDNTTLFITSGLGESGPRARLFNPPEFVMMELKY